jgi:hypothetical protein
MVGPLAHMLKNRFYIGEIVYRGEIHQGEHERILDRDLFDAVQSKMAERSVQRNLKRSRSPSFLVGLIFDDRGNPMSPSHANKKGVRYRYYVSQALLQHHKAEAGSVARVSAPDVEALVCTAVKDARGVDQVTAQTDDAALDSEFISQYVERVVVHAGHIAVALHSPDVASAQPEGETEASVPTRLVIPFVPNGPARKGVVHAPEECGAIDPKTRDALLQAIARSRRWMEAILAGKIASFDAIAAAEGLAERHVRFLMPLAFLSPRIVAAIAQGAVRRDLTVSNLARALPYKWADQEQMLGLG